MLPFIFDDDDVAKSWVGHMDKVDQVEESELISNGQKWSMEKTVFGVHVEGGRSVP